jgi:hypothetical protein
MQTTNLKNNYLPKEGTLDSLFDRLVAYVTEVDKSWPKRVKPATEEAINKLVKLSRIEEKNYDLPKSYKILLNNLGEDDGGIISKHMLANTSISEICEYYEEENKYEPEAINPEMLVFGLFNMGGQLSLDLTCTNEPRVIVSDDGEFMESCSENIEKFAFQNAFPQCEKIRFPIFASYGGSEVMLRQALENNQVNNIFDVVEKYAIEYQFKTAWFSDQHHFVGQRDDASFIVEESSVKNSSSLTFVIFGNDKNFIADFGGKLALSIGVDYNSGTIDYNR